MLYVSLRVTFLLLYNCTSLLFSALLFLCIVSEELHVFDMSFALLCFVYNFYIVQITYAELTIWLRVFMK